MRTGNQSVLSDLNFLNDINTTALELLSRPYVWSQDDVHIADTILRISNLVYNNSSMTPPLDDGLYDQLLVVYQKYDPHYQVGAPPVEFKESPDNQFVDEKVMCTYVSDEDMDSKLYTRNIHDQFTPITYMKYAEPLQGDFPPIAKRVINTPHKYPELVGTLDKCKFVLNYDAALAGADMKPGVQIFERDFMHKCLQAGVVHPAEIFDMVGELKYDGVSVEAEVKYDTIISACSRGDTGDNVATDLTPIFGGYKFPNFNKHKPWCNTDMTFGMKFEAVITKFNMEQLSIIRNKKYVNCRNAVIGLLGASDARKFVNYITLIPLSTSLNLDRAEELRILNTYYNSGEYNRHVFFRGNYQQILFQVKQFMESAEIVRPILPYMIDGVVISFTDPKKKLKLGRVNSVNKWSMAIKFNPSKVRTIFLGYTYNIGKSGEVIPMCHFKPCEFIGSIHTKQTIHSYERFKTLNLAIGDEIDIEYVNDVLSYVTKPETQHNYRPNRVPEQFIQTCPFCGSRIVVSESGKSAKCPNINCHERLIMRMVDMIDRLGIKDVAEESVRALDIFCLRQLMGLTEDRCINAIGEANGAKLYEQVTALKGFYINDFRIMSALSFDGMADEKWKLILKRYTLPELLVMHKSVGLNNVLNDIPGIGPKITRAVVIGFMYYADDIEVIINNFNLVNSKNTIEAPKVAVSGFRNPMITDLIRNNGFDISYKYSVTKGTYALIVANPNENTTKIRKAKDYGVPIMTVDGFLKSHNIIIQ